jgi:hypothetical protein
MTQEQIARLTKQSNESYSNNRKKYLNAFIGKKFNHKGIEYTINGVTENNQNFILNTVDELNVRTVLNYFYN